MKEVSFSEAMRKKYPEWVVLITTIDEHGKPDVMPAGWAMIASHQPPMFAISVGHGRYTHELIRSQKEFVVAFPGPGSEKAIEDTGSSSGRNIDKFEEFELKSLKAREVKPPLLLGCIVNLECKLEGELEAGDHTIFLGKVVAAYIDEEIHARLLNFSGKFAVAVPQILENQF
jgi:flavin reductase (DIM6/NTAB) family NADH-FMN oxidoreductase RutF